LGQALVRAITTPSVPPDPIFIINQFERHDNRDSPSYPERPLNPSGAGHNPALGQVSTQQHYSSRMYLKISPLAGEAVEVHSFGYTYAPNPCFWQQWKTSVGSNRLMKSKYFNKSSCTKDFEISR